MSRNQLLEIEAKLDGYEIGYINQASIRQPCIFCSTLDPVDESSERAFYWHGGGNNLTVPCKTHIALVLEFLFEEFSKEE